MYVIVIVLQFSVNAVSVSQCRVCSNLVVCTFDKHTLY